jgi:hypothetical protein
MTRNATLFAAALASATAHAQLSDHIGLDIHNGRIITIEWESGPGGPDRVFTGQFEDLGGLIFTDDPGTNSRGGTFDIPARLGFNILTELREWDPAAPGFGPTAQSISIEFASGALSATTASGFVPGFTTPIRDETTHPTNPAQWGRHHSHLDFILNGPGGATPADGIYLLELEWFYEPGPGNTTTYDNSAPFWMVFGWNRSIAEIQTAERYVRDFIVPTPGTAAILSLAGLTLLRRRR